MCRACLPACRPLRAACLPACLLPCLAWGFPALLIAHPRCLARATCAAQDPFQTSHWLQYTYWIPFLLSVPLLLFSKSHALASKRNFPTRYAECAAGQLSPTQNLGYQLRLSPHQQCQALPETSLSRCALPLFLLFFLAFSSSLLLLFLFGSCLLSIRFSFSCLPSLRLVLRSVSPVVVSVTLVTLAFPAVSRSFLLHVLTCLYARLLCCSSFLYLPFLRDLPSPCPCSPLRTYDLPHLISGPCPVLSLHALALTPCLLHMSLVLCVYMLCCCSPLSRSALSLSFPQIRSHRIRGVSRVTPPDERAPLTSVVIPIGSVFRRRAAPSALECYLRI